MADLASIERFLYREAGLLDKPDLDSWLALYTEDAWYWIPAQEEQPDALNHVSHVYDDRVMMEIRRRNFVHPRASSKDWSVRCSHIIGNVRLDESEAGDAIRVRSNQHVIVHYREEQKLYAFTATHELIHAGDSYMIRSKRVDLINPEAPQTSLVIYL